MKRLALLSLLLATAAMAGGFTPNAASDTTFTDCSSGGSAAQAVTSGPNLLRTGPSEGVWLCLTASASTCASGGLFIPPNSSWIINISTAQVSASCRSASSTGDMYFVSVAY